MKLIELIIKHVPRDDIHPDAKFFAQDTCSGMRTLFQYLNMPKPKYEGILGYWGGTCSVGGTFNMHEAAEDARDTVVTREQLKYLWSLQDQGYTLVFDVKELPETESRCMEIYFTLLNGVIYHGAKKSEGVITAYRPVKNESCPVVKDYAADINAAIEKMIERNDDTDWPLLDENQFSFDVKKGYLTGTGDSLVIITRKMWDDYVSRKIRVGDKVKVPVKSLGTVLYVGEKKAFLRLDSGGELSISLNRLTRVSE